MKLKIVFPGRNIELGPIKRMIVLDTDFKIMGRAIEVMRREFPGAAIDLLASSKQSSPSAQAPIDGIIPFASKEQLPELKARKYDMTVIPYPDYVGVGCLHWDRLGLTIGAKYTMVFNRNERGFLLTPRVWVGLIMRRGIIRFRVIKLINTFLFFLLLPIMLLDVVITKLIRWPRREA